MAESVKKEAVPGRAAARLDGERSRERILDAAELLLSERGYSGTGIAAISRESGLPASSIYWFFSSKEDLTAAVIERAADRWMDALAKSRSEEGAAPAGVHEFLERALEQSGSRLPDFSRLQILLGLESPEQKPDLLQRLGRVRELGCSLIEASVAASIRERFGDEATSVAKEIAPLALALAQGALIYRHADPDGIDVEHLSEDLEVAILAVAERRLERSKK